MHDVRWVDVGCPGGCGEGEPVGQDCGGDCFDVFGDDVVASLDDGVGAGE